MFVYTFCHSQQHDQSLHYLPFSVWSVSTLFDIFCSLIRFYTICYPFLAVLSRSTLFAILSSLIRVYTNCHSQKSDHGLHYLPFSVACSVSTLFAILYRQSDQVLHCLPFSAVWSGSTLFFYSQSDQGLHFLPFSAVWSKTRSTVIRRNSLIRVYTICHSQQSVLFVILSHLISVYTFYHSRSDQGLYICHSQQSDPGLHYLLFSAVSSRSTLFPILSCLIRVYTVCHSQQSDQGLHYFHYQSDQSLHYFHYQSDQELHYLPFFLSNIIKVNTVCHS